MRCCLPISRQFLWNGFSKGFFLNVSGLFYTKSLVFSEVKKPLVTTKLPTELQDRCKLYLDIVFLSDLPKSVYSCERHETVGIFM